MSLAKAVHVDRLIVLSPTFSFYDYYMDKLFLLKNSSSLHCILTFTSSLRCILTIFTIFFFKYLAQFNSQPTSGAVSAVPQPPGIRPRVRARRGQATDPHSIAERVNLIYFSLIFLLWNLYMNIHAIFEKISPC